jgi:hypothetical protein
MKNQSKMLWDLAQEKPFFQDQPELYMMVLWEEILCGTSLQVYVRTHAFYMHK